MMARAARRRQRFWRRYDCVCADGRALPLAAQSVDLVFSNLMLPWCDDPEALFAQVQRVLRPGGLMLFSTCGPDTLNELRSAWASADAASHVSAFADMPQLGAAMSHAGLSEPVMDRELRLTHYPDVRTLMNELRTHRRAARRRRPAAHADRARPPAPHDRRLRVDAHRFGHTGQLGIHLRRGFRRHRKSECRGRRRRIRGAGRCHRHAGTTALNAKPTSSPVLTPGSARPGSRPLCWPQVALPAWRWPP